MDSIAIVGLSGRFPGARGVEEFWSNLREGVESITRFADEELDRVAIDPGELADPGYVKARGVLDDVETFDAAFFDLTPREATLTDPQQRLFLECAWEALETAGYNPRRHEGAIGVFAGAGANSYLLFNLASAGETTGTIDTFQAFIHNKNDHLTTRVAYKLDLRGPCVTVQTACSTSLVATALACQSLLSYQCDMALAGGVNVFVPQRTGYLHHEGGIGSPDGRCRPFDADAGGTLGGNGAGVVVLKRLEDALADGDTVHAVIRGWALNNDGSVKVGYTAPGVESQAEVVSTAQVFGDVPAGTVSYVEAHGTGTAIGDPIEIQALTRAFRRETDRTGFCAIGSVKGNIGHLDAAAGVAGLIKTVQALRHREIPPSLHFEKPNPRIDFASTPFYVASRLQPWETDGTPRRAGVSSFGLGGTNAHLVLEEAPPAEESGPSKGHQLLVISGQSAAAMEAATERLVGHLREHPEREIADVAFTLQVGRDVFEHRRMLVCRDREEAVSLLEALTPERVVTRSQAPTRRPLTFMFPGQGAQYPGMGSGLYDTEPVYRAEVDRCLEAVRPLVDFDLRALLSARPDNAEAAAALNRTAAAQPALFIVEYALAKLWMSWGVRPDSMIGHSIGEYVAAALAGVMSLEDALELVAARGALIQGMPEGDMLGVPLSERKLSSMLPPELSLAAVNGDELCVVSGPREAVAAFARRLDETGVVGRPLHTSHAFHSAMMEPMLDAFRARVREVRLNPPALPYLSNVTGTWITAEEATDPEYWVRHIRRTVRFHDGVSELMGDPGAALLEVGPGRTLRSVVRWHPKKLPGQVMHASLPHARERGDDREFLLNTVGQLWLAGMEIDWKAMHAGERRRRVPLPTYPFQRRRYWIDMQPGGRRTAARSLARKPDVGDWFWVPVWKEAPLAPAPLSADPAAGEGTWLLFTGEGGISSRVAETLAKSGRDPVTVRAGSGFRELAQGSFEIDPRRREDYSALFARLAGSGRPPARVVHLWSAVGGPGETLDRGLHSLLHLAQALGERAGEEPVAITVVTAGMQEVTGGDLQDPEQSTVLGPVRVIPREYPHLACRSLDVALPQPGSWQEERLAGQIVAEAASGSDAAVVALRGGHRWTQDFEQVKLPPAPEPVPAVREGGVYLVTGGLGGIGLQVAEHLARTARARLVLTGRSAFPERGEWDAWTASHEATDPTSRRIQALKRLEALGAEVLVGSADVADEAAMRAVVDQARERWGEVHGVVHAAGVPSGGLVQMKTPERVAQVLAPKVQGTRVLERVFAGARLDFLVLCSSRTSVMGRFGQVDYTAANAFLDAFARWYRQRTGDYAVSVNWGAWEEVGMAAQGHGAAPEEAGRTPIRTFDHPLLERLIVEEPGRRVYATDFSIDKHWPIDEHRIIGNAVMPGVTYFEMLRAAVQEQAGDRVVTIRESFFVEPMHLKDGEVREGRLEIRDEGPDEFSFQIWSWDGNNPSGRMRRHAMGRIGIDDREPPQKNDLQAILARCPEAAPILQEEREDDLGPRWQSIQRLHLGRNELVLELELPEAFQSDWEKWVFHPAILDRAAGITKVFLAREGYYLPLVYRGIPLARPLSGKLYSHGRFHEEESGDRDTIVFDFNLMDENGDTVLRVEKFTQKRVNDPAAEIRSLADVGGSADFGETAGKTGDGIRPAEGIDALARILAARMEPQVVVSPNDLHAAIEQSDAAVSDAVLESLEARGGGPRGARPQLSSEFVAPSTDIERRIAQVWSEVLGVEEVGVHDNFFELGGDSVQAIQIMARGKQAGLHLTPQQFFQYETIAELAAMIGEVLAQEAEHGAVIGEVPLVPAQRRLLERTGGRGHAADAVLLEAHRPLDARHLGAAVRHLVAHHDALRLQFSREGDAWKQVSAIAGEEMPFAESSAADVPATERVEAARREAGRVAAGLDPAVGPLLHATLFTPGPDAPQLLLLAAHPLVVDAASWPLLLEDLATAYGQLARGQEVRLPARTAPFRAWAEALASQPGTDALAREADFWREEAPGDRAPLPTDRAGAAGAEGTARVVTTALDADLVRQATDELPRARRAETDEVLLSALAAALGDWSGARTARVDVARDARGGEAGDADYSRTVGPMEHLVPVQVELNGGDPLAALKGAKQRLRLLAGHAASYGVLRHLDAQGDVGAMLRSAPQAEVAFRYTDLSAAGASAAPWDTAAAAPFAVRAGDVPRAHLIEVDAARTADGIRITWTYSPEVHDGATVEGLAARFEAALRALAEASRAAGAEDFTPEDFPLAGLDQAALGQLAMLIRKADQGA